MCDQRNAMGVDGALLNEQGRQIRGPDVETAVYSLRTYRGLLERGRRGDIFQQIVASVIRLLESSEIRQMRCISYRR